MTEKVTFYRLKSKQLDGKLLLTCRLISTAFNHGHKVFVSSPSTEFCNLLNIRLWTFAWSSFIPHTKLEFTANRPINLEKYPVVIGNLEPPKVFNDVLVTLHERVPSFFEQFNIIVDPVDATNEEVSQADRRFEEYSSRLGIEPTTHYI